MCCFRRFNRHATQPTRPCLMLHFKYLYDLWGCQFWELQFFESSFGNFRVCYTGKSTISVSFSGWPAGNLQSHGIYFQGRSVNLFNSFPCFIIMASFCWYQVLVTPARCVQKQQLCYMWMRPVCVLWNCISDCSFLLQSLRLQIPY